MPSTPVQRTLLGGYPTRLVIYPPLERIVHRSIRCERYLVSLSASRSVVCATCSLRLATPEKGGWAATAKDTKVVHFIKTIALFDFD